MAFFCFCSQLRHRKKHHQGLDGTSVAPHQLALPTRPPPARLPPPPVHGIALSPQSTVARSSLTNPLPHAVADESIQLAELVIEDSEDDLGEGGLPHTGRSRSSSTLEAVKAHIRRHRSQDPIARQSETEEQVARRAEVKRLMRMRIQEELRTESLPVGTGKHVLPDPAASSVASASMPGNGPRDTIEFAVDEEKDKKENDLARAKVAHLSKSWDDGERRMPRAPSSRLSAHSCIEETRQPNSRPVSLYDWIENDLEAAQAHHQRHVRQRSSLPDIPASPQLRPTRVASPHEAASLASWRLSLCADRLADLLTPDKTNSLFRPLVSPASSCSTLGAEPEHHRGIKRMRSRSSPVAVLSAGMEENRKPSQASLHSNCRRKSIPKSHSLVRDESPVGLWLRAQSQHFRLSTASPWYSDNDSDDGIVNPIQNASLQQPPASFVIHSPSRRSFSQPGDRETASQLDLAKCLGVKEVQTLPSREEIHQSTLRDPSSASIHSSTITGTPQTPVTGATGTSVQESVRRGFAGLRLPSLRWHQSAHKGQDEYKPASPQDPCSDQPNPNLVHSHTRHTTLEAGSEASSFFRREVELRAVEERFRESHLRKEPLTPVESKFHEVLGDNPRLAARNSLLSRLELVLPIYGERLTHSLDGHDLEQISSASPAGLQSGTQQTHRLDVSSQGHLQVPSSNYRKIKSISTSPQSSDYGKGSGSRGFSSSRDGDETAEMWKRALMGESAAHSPRRSTSSQLVVPQLAMRKARDSAQNLRAPCSSEVEDRSGPGSRDPSPIRAELPTQEDAEVFRQSLERSNVILQDWSQQLERQERASPPGPAAIYKRSKTPPASWARFPSHNREERNAAAGEVDNVKPRDFAVKGVSAAGDISWKTDKVDEGEPSQRSIVRIVSGKFTRPFRSRWSKLINGRGDADFKDKSMRGARRISIQESGSLKHPKLELLPTAGRYREPLALEREIDAMKGIGGRKTASSSDQYTASDNRISLIEKTADVVQNDGSPAGTDLLKSRDMAKDIKGQENSMKVTLPVTPKTQTRLLDPNHGTDMTSSSGERYATPLTHFSYSRPLTPQRTSHASTAHTLDSVKSTASVIRYASLCDPKETFDHSNPMTWTHLQSGRRSASPVTPGFG